MVKQKMTHNKLQTYVDKSGLTTENGGLPSMFTWYK